MQINDLKKELYNTSFYVAWSDSVYFDLYGKSIRISNHPRKLTRKGKNYKSFVNLEFILEDKVYYGKNAKKGQFDLSVLRSLKNNKILFISEIYKILTQEQPYFIAL